jgi:hypothetical protein
MSFLLSEQRDKDFQGYWRRYEEYIESVRDLMPPGAMKLALSAEWYDFRCHHCPHDASLQEFKITVGATASGPKRENSGELKLLGAYHDRLLLLHYPRLMSFNIQASALNGGLGEWRYDEFRLSTSGNLLHEIEWASGARWLIEADDIEFQWQPFEAEPV